MFNKLTVRCIIGVVLSAAPIIATAQQTSANVVLDVQSMRTEIAQLRNLIERQDYRINQLQKQVQNLQGNTVPVTPEVTSTEGVAVNAQATNVQTPVEDSANVDAQPNSVNPNSVNPDPVNREINIDSANSGFISPVLQLPSAGVAGSVASTAQQSPSEVPMQEVPQPEVPQPVVELPSSNEAVVRQDRVIDSDQTVSANPQLNSSNTDLSLSEAIASEQVKTVSAVPMNSPALINNVMAPLPNGVSQAAQVEAVKPLVDEVTPAAPLTVSEDNLYQDAFEKLKQGDHSNAVVLFKKQLSAYPKGELADDAYYWIGESMYINSDHKSAKQNFKQIIDGFKQSPRLPDAMLKMAYIEQEQGNKIEARVLLEEIIQYHPRSNAAISAKNRLAEIAK